MDNVIDNAGTAPGKETRLTRERLLRLMDVLNEAPPIEGMTAHVLPGGTVNAGAGSNPRQSEWLGEMKSLEGERIAASETGAVAYWSDQIKLLVIPPFPLQTTSVSEGFDVYHLRKVVTASRVTGVVLVRLGRYSVGVFRGRDLVTSKTDTRYVKGRHKKGGSSQKRFARIRGKQIFELFGKTCTVVSEKFAPYEREIDFIFLGGERHTVGEFLKQCPYLQRLEPRIMGRMLPIGEPRLRELERMPGEIWKSVVVAHSLPQGFPFQGLD